MLQTEFEGGDLVQCASSGIYSEEEVKVKCVLPYLEKIGYEKENLQLDRPVKIGRGLTVYPDIVVLVDEEPAMVVETKRPGESLANYVNQVISYSRLLQAPIAALTNGFKTEVYDAFEAVSIGRDIPPLSEIQEREKVFLTDEMRERAESTLVIFENVPKFSDVLSECHDIVWNRDHLSPEMAFDEVSKLLFLKVNEEKRGKEEKKNRLSLEEIKGYDEEGLADLIEYTIFKDTKKELQHIFTDENERINLKPSSIKEIISKLAPFDVLGTDVDVKGLTFETFLEKTFRGDLGQYSTPREVINFMVELVEPTIGERIVDPAAGSGGFLIKVFEELGSQIQDITDPNKRDAYFEDLKTKKLFGMDANPRIARICKENMFIHGDGHVGVYHRDGLLDYKEIKENSFDVVLTNPPFGGKVKSKDSHGKSILEHYDFGKKEGLVRKSQGTEILFLERCIKLLRNDPPGRLAIILPDGILTNSSLKYVRDYIREDTIIKAVISLPHHTFMPKGSGVKTSVLYLQKKNGLEQGDIFMGIPKYIGYDAPGRPINKNDLLIIPRKFKEFEIGELND